MHWHRIVILVLIITLSTSYYHNLHRDLYDIGRPDHRLVNVSTANYGLKYPVGAVLGHYKNNYGLFISTFTTNAIYFMDTNSSTCEISRCQTTQVTGFGSAGTSDGTLATASFSYPSRMAYLHQQGLLLVTDRANGYIRMINFHNSRVKSMIVRSYIDSQNKAAGYKYSRLRVSGSQLASNNPEIDIKTFRNHLYVSDSGGVYNITGHDGTLDTLYNYTVVHQYSALKTWQKEYSFDKSSNKVYITSMAIDPIYEVMYIGLSYQRNAIIVMPLQITDYNQIYVLTSDGMVWDKIPIIFPIPMNGYIPPYTDASISNSYNASAATVTFPMHMHYDAIESTLYWIEVFAASASGTKSGALGAVAVRRLRFDRNIIDYYAGNVGSFRAYLGKVTGYVDGTADIAQFSYPTTLVFDSTRKSIGGGPLIYVVDYQNQAIRTLSTYVKTSTPTIMPTISFKPTLEPSISFIPTLEPTISVKPTSSPTRRPTRIPTTRPSSRPVVSQVPTSMNTVIVSNSPISGMNMVKTGTCLDVTLVDQFGDGWSGASLILTHPVYSSSYSSFRTKPHSPTFDQNPLELSVCASVDKLEDYGLYTFTIQYPVNTFYLWEILWHIKNEEDGKLYTGTFESTIVFKFDTKGFSLFGSDRLYRTQNQCVTCRHPRPTSAPVFRGSSAIDGGNGNGNKYKNNRQIGGLNLETDDDEPDADVRHVIPRGTVRRPPVREEGQVHSNSSFYIHLYDSSGNGWFSNDGKGASYYITNENKVDLLATGTVCGDLKSMTCVVELSDGQYYLRIGGAEDTHKKDLHWSFCGVKGIPQEELSFTISDGKCISGRIQSYRIIAQNAGRTVVMMEGQVLLKNVYTEAFSLSEQRTIEQALASVVHLNNPYKAAILESCLTEDKIFCAQYTNNEDVYTQYNRRRQLLSYSIFRHVYVSLYSYLEFISDMISNSITTTISSTTTISTTTINEEKEALLRQLATKTKSAYIHGIRFTVALTTEDYGVDGTQLYDVMDFANRTTSRMTSAVFHGQLQSEIRSIASMTNTPSLMFVMSNDVLPLVTTSISYIATSMPTSAPTHVPSISAEKMIPEDTIKNEDDTTSNNNQNNDNNGRYKFMSNYVTIRHSELIDWDDNHDNDYDRRDHDRYEYDYETPVRNPIASGSIANAMEGLYTPIQSSSMQTHIGTRIDTSISTTRSINPGSRSSSASTSPETRRIQDVSIIGTTNTGDTSSTSTSKENEYESVVIETIKRKQRKDDFIVLATVRPDIRSVSPTRRGRL
eukprot:gene8058-16518_t